MSEENQENNTEPKGSVEPSFLNPDGTFGDMSKAPENTRNFITKKGFKSMDEMTGAHVELEGMLGQRDKMITIPEDGDTEGWRKVYTKFGCPEKAEGYVFTPREGDPKPESSLITMFKEYAHGKGMNQESFQDIIHFQMDAIKAGDAVYAQEILDQQNKDQKAIRERFDTEDQYNEFTQKGMAFAEKFKLDENSSVMDVIENKGLAHDPVVLDMLGQLADMTVEDPLPSGRTRTNLPVEDRITQIQKDPAFTNRMDPRHYPLMAEYNALFVSKQEG